MPVIITEDKIKSMSEKLDPKLVHEFGYDLTLKQLETAVRKWLQNIVDELTEDPEFFALNPQSNFESAFFDEVENESVATNSDPMSL